MSRASLIAKLVVGVACILVACSLVAVRVHGAMLWSLREASVAPEVPSPANEGKWVVAIATLDADELASDPEYVLPRRFVVLDRVIVRGSVDSDGDLHWENVAALGSVRIAHNVPAKVRVGGYAIDGAAASFVEPPSLSLRDEDLRTDSAPPGVALAKWDAARSVFWIGTDIVPSAELKVPATNAAPAVANVAGALSFHGYERGARVAVLGRQRGAALEPVRLRPGEPERVVVSRASSVAEFVDAEETRVLGGTEVLLGLAACLGVVLSFCHPWGVLFFAFTVGVGSVFGALLSDGWLAGLLRLLLAVASVAIPFVTVLFAVTTRSLVPAFAWIVVSCALVAWIRARKGFDVTLEMEDEL